MLIFYLDIPWIPLKRKLKEPSSNDFLAEKKRTISDVGGDDSIFQFEYKPLKRKKTTPDSSQKIDEVCIITSSSDTIENHESIESESPSDLLSQEIPVFEFSPRPPPIVNPLKATANAIREMRRMSYQPIEDFSLEDSDLQDFDIPSSTQFKEAVSPFKLKKEPSIVIEKETIDDIIDFKIKAVPLEREQVPPNPLKNTVIAFKETKKAEHDMLDDIEFSQDIDHSQIDNDSIFSDLITPDPSQVAQEPSQQEELTLIREKFLIPQKPIIEEEIISEPFIMQPTSIITGNTEQINQKGSTTDIIKRVIEKFNIKSKPAFTIPDDFQPPLEPIYRSDMVHAPLPDAPALIPPALLSHRRRRLDYDYFIPYIGSNITIEGTVIKCEPMNMLEGHVHSNVVKLDPLSFLNERIRSLRLTNNSKNNLHCIYIKDNEHEVYYQLIINQHIGHSWSHVFHTDKSFRFKDVTTRRILLKEDKSLYDLFRSYGASMFAANVVYVDRQADNKDYEPKFPSSQKSDLSIIEEEDVQDNIHYRCKLIVIEATTISECMEI